jgi:Zn-dependent peptidase ImmA (M78 family)
VIYKRPVAVFFFPSPPAEVEPQQEFRTLPGDEFERLEADTRLALRDARAYQISLLELSGGTNPAERLITRDIRASLHVPIEQLVSQVREYLGVSVINQQRWPTAVDAFKSWRATLESAGVFVFKRPFDQGEISGFCLRGEQFPLILINNSTPHTRQIFTLFHELSHLLFDISGITTVDVRFEERFSGQARQIEITCNRFAGEFLVPTASFPWDIFEGLDTLEESIARVANLYNVSREVILRRLLDAGRVDEATYEARASQWIAEAQRARSIGRQGGNYYANQATYLGDAFLELGFAQYRAGNVTLPDLADHFGMRAQTVIRLEDYLLGRR